VLNCNEDGEYGNCLKLLGNPTTFKPTVDVPSPIETWCVGLELVDETDTVTVSVPDIAIMLVLDR
jgi:hypothetical protein